MASSDVQQLPPFLLTANAANFVPTKLWFHTTGTNYLEWKEQMLYLIQSQELLGFIDGTKPPPPEADADDKNQEYDLWRRTDMLLRESILCWLNDDVVFCVCAVKTSRDVWLVLEMMSRRYLNSAPATFDLTVEDGRAYVQEELDYFPLSRAISQGEWEAAKRILDHHPGSGIKYMKRNALHAAATAGISNHFVEELFNELPNECKIPVQISGKTVKKCGDTALSIAVTARNKELANYLATKMPELLYIPRATGDFPVQIAAAVGDKEMLKYLISVTKSDNDFGVNPYTGEPGLRLLHAAIIAEFLDIALSLVEKYPDLARLTYPPVYPSALEHISSKESIFRSARRFTFWERVISSRVSLNTTGGDIESINTHNGQAAVFQRLNVMLWKFADRLGHIKSIKEKTLLKLQALELIKCLCKEIEWLGYMEAKVIYCNACGVAAARGIPEVVEEIVKVFPDALYCSTSSPLHLAVENRSEDVYNLLSQMGHYKRCSLLADSDGNNIVHLAGKRAPLQKLDKISGAALQMQYEMQWYKELEKFGGPLAIDVPNNAGKTAKMVFTEEHEQLKQDGEKWMKDTANSCTIAAALIVTVMFAAAITVPGGNDSSNGFPIFSRNAVFIVFAISDAVSLFTSANSLLMFLAILTSRYAEQDFLRILPKRLIIGLGTLFLSITFMMVAFSATIYLVFGRKKAWVLIPVGGLACLPVASFVLLQFPLLRDLISSTYGSGMFPKQRTPVKIRPSQISSEHQKAEA